MKIKLAILGLIPAFFLAAGSAHATQTIVALDGPYLSTKYFDTVDSGPGFSFLANYGATPKIATTAKTATNAKGAFDYLFEFTVPVGGTGKGSFSATFSSSSSISKVIVGGVTYTYPTQNTSLTIAPFAVVANQVEIIEVVGNLGSAKSLTFDGTAGFDAAVPEPATWTTFLLGFGFMGLALRRKLQPKIKFA